jgi:hypothetical protein
MTSSYRVMSKQQRQPEESSQQEGAKFDFLFTSLLSLWLKGFRSKKNHTRNKEKKSTAGTKNTSNDP